MTIPVTFDTAGLVGIGDLRWRGRDGDEITVHVFDAVPDLPAALSDLDTLRRENALRYARSGATLIECDVLELQGVQVLRQLVKVRNPGQEHGLVFVGSLIFPRATRSAVLKAQCVEQGTTGMRESIVMANVGPDGFFLENPFAPDVDFVELGALPSSVADDPALDARFPGHPLTRARSILAKMQDTARVDPAFRALPPFVPQPPEPPEAAGYEEMRAR